ncbi:MAG: hypothetical protein JWQ30_1578, partial [Sediminibacterium sp.]|nr:hypothetical protein [Sediminibacterium sp.]
MDQTTARLEELLNKSSLSEEEIHWLLEYLRQSDTPELRQALLEKFAGDLSSHHNTTSLQPGISEKMLQAILAETETSQETTTSRPARWKRIAVAVCIIGLIAVSYFIISKNKIPDIPVTTAKVIRTD